MVNVNYLATFTAAECRIFINNCEQNTINSVEVISKGNLSEEDFYKTIPELNGANFSSIKNVNAILLLDYIYGNPGSFVMEDKSNIKLKFENDWTQKACIEFCECYVLSKRLKVNMEGFVTERVIIGVSSTSES